jgi:hypothetical protein
MAKHMQDCKAYISYLLLQHGVDIGSVKFSVLSQYYLCVSFDSRPTYYSLEHQASRDKIPLLPRMRRPRTLTNTTKPHWRCDRRLAILDFSNIKHIVSTRRVNDSNCTELPEHFHNSLAHHVVNTQNVFSTVT